MQRMKAFLLLLLFCGSTVGSFATVHQCGDKITDIDILSVADCEHEKEEALKVCESHCCHDTSKEQNKDEEAEDDCCSTLKLSSQSLEVLIQNVEKTASPDQVLNQGYHYSFQKAQSNAENTAQLYRAPYYYKDILLEIQCFRI